MKRLLTPISHFTLAAAADIAGAMPYTPLMMMIIAAMAPDFEDTPAAAAMRLPIQQVREDAAQRV